MKLCVLLLAGLCVAGGQARAGLFNDDEAREQIRQVETRVSKLEEVSKQQADANRQQTRSLLDLQAQIETQNAELRRLNGKNEELLHSLQDAEKRQKDFYIDLDTRVRHFESVEAAASAVPLDKAADDPAVENHAYEAAYKLFKAGNHQKAIEAFQEFLKKFPESVHVPNVHYEMGSAYFALNDYKSALASYQLLVSKYSFSPKTPDAMLRTADCQEALQNKAAVRKILKQIVAKYPGSETADEARKRLETLK
jgi:tol-pal system protein YbgF